MLHFVAIFAANYKNSKLAYEITGLSTKILHTHTPTKTHPQKHTHKNTPTKTHPHTHLDTPTKHVILSDCGLAKGESIDGTNSIAPPPHWAISVKTVHK